MEDDNRKAATAKQRRLHILERIAREDTIAVTLLAEELNVSEMTIRRDLADLEKAGHLRRVHGGAVSAFGRGYEPPYALRSNRELAAKQRIARLASSLVDEGDSIALDVGSTVCEIARELATRRGLTVVTPSLRAAAHLIENRDIQTIVAGGIVRAGEESLVGDLALQAFRTVFVDKLFLAVGGIDVQNGLTEFNWDDTLVKRAMIASARKVFLVADASKFGRSAFAKVGELGDVHALICDEMPPEPLLQKLRDHGITVHLAGDGDIQSDSQTGTNDKSR